MGQCAMVQVMDFLWSISFQNPPPKAGHMGLVPDLGTKILHALGTRPTKSCQTEDHNAAGQGTQDAAK